MTRSVLGDHPAFDVPEYSLVSAWEIPLYVIMGIALGGYGVVFTRILDYFEDLFDKIKMSPMLKPALGGLLLGCIALFYPQVLADGYETIKLDTLWSGWSRAAFSLDLIKVGGNLDDFRIR